MRPAIPAGSGAKLFFVVRLGALAMLVWVQTKSVAWVAVAVVPLVVALASYLLFVRRRVSGQIRAAVETGFVDIKADLVTQSLPGSLPATARSTMGLARHNAPAMPVQLTIHDNTVHLNKTMLGFQPFAVEIALGEIESVTAGAARVTPVGATLTLKLRDSTEVLLQLQCKRVDAEALAKVLENRALASPPAQTPTGVAVTSPAPPRP